jgi:hypothetical protein
MTLFTNTRGLMAVAALAASPVCAQDTPRTIVFVGNSYTYGAYSPEWKYRAQSVTDLNEGGYGGVPALFKLFTQEAGLNYAVSLETSPSKTLQWHWENRRAVLDRAWDHVVLQGYSTLDPQKPGDPASTIEYTRRLAAMFVARNPRVEISLTATWSRPDLTYPPGGHWYGQPIAQMATDVRHGYDLAAQTSPAIDKVNPVGQAFTCAIQTGLADPDPYDGIAFGKIDLWAWDHYHASAQGYYLEALVIFANVTGKDPRTLGAGETAASELGFAPADTVRLQNVAQLAVSGGDCAKGS